MIPISKDLVDQFDYEDGFLWWKTIKNGRFVGPVGYVNSDGYLSVKYKNKSYRVHRIIWAMHRGDTQLQIDHINRCRSDNRIENLRAVTNKENSQNQLRFRKGGVTWDKTNSRWRVSWRGKYLASTKDKFEAWCIRKSREVSYGNS